MSLTTEVPRVALARTGRVATPASAWGDRALIYSQTKREIELAPQGYNNEDKQQRGCHGNWWDGTGCTGAEQAIWRAATLAIERDANDRLTNAGSGGSSTSGRARGGATSDLIGLTQLRLAGDRADGAATFRRSYSLVEY